MRRTFRPLTAAEQHVAAQNLWVVESFLRQQRLPFDEWFDVVIFRYLRTVIKWFEEPALYQYEFSTIAWNAMRSAVGHEREKRARRPKTVSLYAPIPGTDGLTYIDAIPDESMNYIPYITEVSST